MLQGARTLLDRRLRLSAAQLAAHGLTKHEQTLKAANFARQCLPPFPIIPTITRQVMEMCMKGAMRPNFKIRFVPGKMLKNIRKFAGFPVVAMAFARNAKALMKVFASMSVKDEPSKALTHKTEEEDDEEEDGKVNASDLGPTFAKGQARANAAKSSAAQGEAEASKMPSGGDDADEETDAESEAGDGGHLNLADDILELKFAEIDADGDGSISAAELKVALEQERKDLKADAVAKMMQEADANGDGEIDLNEFKMAMRTGTSFGGEMGSDIEA